jgi:hypothetical protein
MDPGNRKESGTTETQCASKRETCHWIRSGRRAEFPDLPALSGDKSAAFGGLSARRLALVLPGRGSAIEDYSGALMVKFRAVTEADRNVLAEWISRDSGHAGKVVPDFFMDGSDVASVYVIEDEKGPVMAVRAEADRDTMRLHIQFCNSPRRSLNSLQEGYPVVRNDAKNRGFKTMTFSSCSPALIRFLAGMGFEAEVRTEL